MLNPMLYPCYDMYNNFGQDSGVIQDKKRLAEVAEVEVKKNCIYEGDKEESRTWMEMEQQNFMVVTLISV